jgi:hypothetical protein
MPALSEVLKALQQRLLSNSQLADGAPFSDRITRWRTKKGGFTHGFNEGYVSAQDKLVRLGQTQRFTKRVEKA